jgi:hypothetical protein
MATMVAALTTIDGVLAELGRLEGLITDGTISEAREVAIRNEKAALYGNLAILQQAAQQGKRNSFNSFNLKLINKAKKKHY